MLWFFSTAPSYCWRWHPSLPSRYTAAQLCSQTGQCSGGFSEHDTQQRSWKRSRPGDSLGCRWMTSGPKSFTWTNLPAQNEGLLAINPDTGDAAVLVVVVVACRADAGPDEPAVGEDRAESCQEGGAWRRGTGTDDLLSLIPGHCSYWPLHYYITSSKNTSAGPKIH